MSTTTETPEEALQRIQSLGFCQNDATVIMAFSDAGIDPASIEPRVNVLTFRAWKAKGRQVAKGAISVRVQTWIPCKESKAKTKDGEQAKQFMRPKIVSLFHESQTIPKDAEKGTPPAAANNPSLVREGTYEAWTEETTLEQVEAEMTEELTGVKAKPQEFSGPRIADLQPPVDGNGRIQASLDDVSRVEVLNLDESGELVADTDDDKNGEDRPETCNCPMVGVVTNVDCPIHGGR